MIKKILHYACALTAGVLWSALLALLFQQVFLLVYRADILDLRTYKIFSEYWNGGGVLRGKDVMMICCLFLYFPLCVFGWFKLWHYKYLQLVTVPLNKIFNHGLDNYRAPDVNIKNLKVEEKKTLDQIVQERLETEQKKFQEENASSGNFRQKIIDQLQRTTKK